MKKIAPASDPTWADEEYRTATLNGLIALHKLKSDDVAVLTGTTTGYVRHWRSGKTGRIIPIAVLRALIYDLQGE